MNGKKQPPSMAMMAEKKMEAAHSTPLKMSAPLLREGRQPGSGVESCAVEERLQFRWKQLNRLDAVFFFLGRYELGRPSPNHQIA